MSQTRSRLASDESQALVHHALQPQGHGSVLQTELECCPRSRGAEHFSSTYYVCHPYWTPEIGNNLAYVLRSSEYLVTRPIVAGNDTDGSPLYICQALINGGLYPGKVGPSSSFAGGCSIAIDGKELYVMNFGLLTDGVYGNPNKPFP